MKYAHEVRKVAQTIAAVTVLAPALGNLLCDQAVAKEKRRPTVEDVATDISLLPRLTKSNGTAAPYSAVYGTTLPTDQQVTAWYRSEATRSDDPDPSVASEVSIQVVRHGIPTMSLYFTRGGEDNKWNAYQRLTIPKKPNTTFNLHALGETEVEYSIDNSYDVGPLRVPLTTETNACLAQDTLFQLTDDAAGLIDTIARGKPVYASRDLSVISPAGIGLASACPTV
jgi:hypothetical protein